MLISSLTAKYCKIYKVSKSKKYKDKESELFYQKYGWNLNGFSFIHIRGVTMEKQRAKYKPYSKGAYNGVCSVRLSTEKMGDYIRRLEKLYSMTNDEVLKEDILILKDAVENLYYGFKREW